jgi:hypothetical protein
MRDGVEMTCRELRHKLQLYARTRHTTILLSCSGVVLVGTAFAGILTMGGNINARGLGDRLPSENIYFLLAMVFVTLTLSVAGIARLPEGGQTEAASRFSSRKYWTILGVLLLIHCTLALLLDKPKSADNIDTYTFQRDACGNLLKGLDPYGGTQSDPFDASHSALFFGPGMVVNGRVQVGLQYPPLTLVWVLPGYLLGDVRYSYILAIVISALLLFSISPNAPGLWVVSLLLLSPLTFAVENRCWTEPLVLMTLTATVYAATKKRWWFPIGLGLFLATKQYNVLALPLIGYFVHPFRWKAYWKLAAQSLAVVLATVLPFLLWNAYGLWHDLVMFHFSQPFRQDAISFAVLFPAMEKIGPLLLMAFIAWALRPGRRNLSNFPAAYGIAVLLFFATSKQAFANYYFLVAHCLLLSVAALPVSPNSGMLTYRAKTVPRRTRVLS